MTIFRYNPELKRIEQQPEMDRPKFDYEFGEDGPTNSQLESAEADYDNCMILYERHLASLKSYPSEPLPVNTDLVEGRDWKKDYQINQERYLPLWKSVTENEYNRMPDEYRRIVAIPLQPKEEPVKEEGEVWSDLKTKFIDLIYDCNGTSAGAITLINYLKESFTITRKGDDKIQRAYTPPPLKGESEADFSFPATPLTELYFHKQVMNPYPTGTQEYTIYEKGFTECFHKFFQSTQPKEEGDEVSFAEWIGKQGVFCGLSPDGKRRWHKMVGLGKALTTAELFKEYKSQP